jgi:hypothetical protein
MLNDWLAERGEATVGPGSSPGGPGRGEGVGSGLGSGILSRYTKTTTPAASRPTGSGVTPAPDTAKLYASPTFDTDEDIGLAPLDEDNRSPAARQAKKASASSGVLSDDSGAKVTAKESDSKQPADKSGASKSGSIKQATGAAPGSGSGKKSDAAKSDSEAASLSAPSKPSKPRSIFEEEYAAPTEEDPIARRARRASQVEYDPLHPPGYRHPSTKTPAWVWGAGAAAIVVVVLVLWAIGEMIKAG